MIPLHITAKKSKQCLVGSVQHSLVLEETFPLQTAPSAKVGWSKLSQKGRKLFIQRTWSRERGGWAGQGRRWYLPRGIFVDTFYGINQFKWAKINLFTKVNLLEDHLLKCTRCSINRRVRLDKLQGVSGRRLDALTWRLAVSLVFSNWSLCPLKFRRISDPTPSVSSAILCALSSLVVPSSRVCVPASRRDRVE